MQINRLDNVDVNLEDGHKYALCDIKKDENIIKYGNPIGHATVDIKAGEHVHTHNVKTNLSGNLEYTYEPVSYDLPEEDKDRTFMGYVRENGDVGIRNEIWIVNTVGCVNKVAERIASSLVIPKATAFSIPSYRLVAAPAKVPSASLATVPCRKIC